MLRLRSPEVLENALVLLAEAIQTPNQLTPPLTGYRFVPQSTNRSR